MRASRIACLWPKTPDPAALLLLVDVAAGFSPDVERADDAVYMQVGDLGRLYATEAELFSAIHASAAELGVTAGVAIASDKGTARVLCRAQACLGRTMSPATAIVRRGGERDALAPLPIEALGASPDLLAKLEAFGLRTIGALQALPRSAVATRLGAAGATLHRLATGESAEPLIPTPPVAELSEEQALLDPIDNLEPLLFILRGLLDRLVARLRARGQACGDLNLRLVLVPRGEEVRRIAVAAPTQKVAPLLDLVRVCLEGKPPPATVEKLVLSTMPTRPRPTQLDLFSPAGPAPERLAATLARLEALCGSGRVGMPVLPDTHAPSAAALAPFKSAVVAPIKPAEKEPAQPPPLLLAARVVRPPQPVAVQVRGAAPAEVDLYEPSRGADKGLFGRSGRKPDKSRLVRRAGGPYRLRDVRGARDYYDVELDDGALYRLFYDMTEKSWFLDAVYD